MSLGTKHDQDKPRMELIDCIFLIGIAKVLTFGARKYEAENWRKGISSDRLYGALQRHLTAWLGGEDLDPESGLPHLDHAGCELMFLRWMMTMRPELDSRYKNPAPVSSGDKGQSYGLRCLRCGRIGHPYEKTWTCPCTPDPGGLTVHQASEHPRYSKWVNNCARHGETVGYGDDASCIYCKTEGVVL